MTVGFLMFYDRLTSHHYSSGRNAGNHPVQTVRYSQFVCAEP